MGSEVGEVEALYEAVNIFLGIPILITLAGITEITIILKFLQVFVLYVEKRHQSLIEFAKHSLKQSFIR
ncbi:MAG: hypothetical protein J1F35_08815 [Erysipelotrichales bacterium]|nr:hypothetical protein [Erysipelotrichales bacterium]